MSSTRQVPLQTTPQGHDSGAGVGAAGHAGVQVVGSNHGNIEPVLEPKLTASMEDSSDEDEDDCCECSKARRRERKLLQTATSLKKKGNKTIMETDTGVKLTTRKFSFYGFGGNPVVTFLSQGIIWALVIASIVQPNALFLNAAEMKRSITKNFTWLYIGAQNIWVFFIAYIWLSPKYSQIKLGRKKDKPEFSTVAWFMMMFMSAGAGTGLIYYGVGEPIYHLSYNRFVAKGTLTYNEISQEAMNLTYYHWGVHAWMCYTIFALIQGIVTHRMGLPMTIRSCFFPIFGPKIFGWFGDVIDVLSLVSTVFGICTQMGIGAVQLNTGFNRLNNQIERSILVQVFLIAIMTVIGGISAHAGLKRGIRFLSLSGFLLATAVLLMILLVEDTTFLLNFIVQCFGYHLQWFLQLGFHTDAFEQLDGGVDGKSGPAIWMDWWTVFYWGWWVAWAPFVGLFVARISKGRTLREVINASLSGPVLYNFVWFAIFGGSGLKMERAAIIDACLGQCSITKGGKQFLRRYCDPVVNASPQELASNAAVFLQKRPGGCTSIVQLSTRDLSEMWFELISQYDNIATTLVVMSIISMILFFITTNDSGAIVLDLIATSGNLQSNKVQKQLWSLTLGATSVALLIAGGSLSLSAIQTAMVALGLPMTILTTVLCTSLNAACAMEVHPDTNKRLTVMDGRYRNLLSNENGFEFWNTSMLGGVCDTIEFVLSLGASSFPPWNEWKLFGIALCAPWYLVGVVLAECAEVGGTGKTVNIWSFTRQVEVMSTQVMMIGVGISYYAFLVFTLLETYAVNMWVLGIAFYLIFGCMVATTRGTVRRTYFLYGDLFRDVLASFVWYPFALVQMYHEVKKDVVSDVGIGGITADERKAQ